MNKWHNSKSGWLEYFKAHYDWIRPVVSFFSGSRAANQLDKGRYVDENSSDEDLRIVYGILKKAMEDGGATQREMGETLHFMTGWTELTDLCCEAHILWEEAHVPAL